MRQLSFEDASYWNRNKKTRKQRFFDTDGEGASLGSDAGVDSTALLQGRKVSSADRVGNDVAHLFFATVVRVFGSGDGG